MDKVFFPPLSPLFVILILLLPLLIGFFIINVINTAFIKLGFSPILAFSILFLSLIGSMINIPIRESYQEIKTEYTENFFFKNLYPRNIVEKTVIAVNFGGAVIPILVSIFLILKSDVPIWKLFIAIIIVTIIFDCRMDSTKHFISYGIITNQLPMHFSKETMITIS